MMSPESLQRVEAVVVGASAGGVEALSTLLAALPAALLVPLFIVLHLPQRRPSLLVELFQAKCAVPVQEAQDKDPVEPGAVYVAPPDYHLLLEQGPQLALSVDSPVNFSRPSIDVLFESAADVYGAGLLGIVLTGGSSDGAIGLETIHRSGGITAVQDPATALAPTMPAAAMKQSPVDWVLPLDRIADLLRTLRTRNGL